MKNSLKHITFFVLAGAVLLNLQSCKIGKNYTRAEQELPVNYRQDFVKDSSIANMPWWKLFKDPVLIELINTAFTENKNIKIAIVRMDESRLYLDISKADLLPSVNYGSGAGSTYNTTTSNFSNSVNVGVNVSYTLDLWHRVRTLNDAALQEYLATEEAYKAVSIGIIASMANAYISLRDIDNRLSISEKTARNFSENLAVMQAKFDAGFVSEVDLTQSKIQLIEAQISVETFMRLRTQLENGISILLGDAPKKIPRGLALEEQINLPEVPVGLPSELIDRRPDILQAESKLHAQTLRIGTAEALQYPSLTLSADMGVQLLNPTTFFAGLSAQVLGPIFNGGRIKTGIEVEKIRTEQLLYQYQLSYLNALREVEDAMISQKTFNNEYALRKLQMELATKAAHLSWVRYDGGLTSYLEVLSLQGSQFSAELKASVALQQELASIINLYQALGGGWEVTEEK